MANMFNLTELKQDWEDGFYESEWSVDSFSMTEVEENICKEICSFLPRHMLVYDWNLPYAEEIILIIRRQVKAMIGGRYETNGTKTR